MSPMDGHDKNPNDLYTLLDSRFEGLSSKEAKERLEKYGKNTIPSGRSISPWKILLSQFTDLLIIILLVSGLITGILGIIEKDSEAIIDVVAIFIVVAVNAGLGFYQELTAEKAMNALKNLSVSEVVVVRDQIKTLISSEDVVPGDTVSLDAGSTIAADIRLVESYEVRTLEGILTGESLPVRKQTNILPEKTPLADRINMLYKGTTVVNGSGLGIVVATGLETELGKIATSLMDIKSDDTPLQKKLAKLAKQLTIGVVILSAIILLLGFLLMDPEKPSDVVIFAIGLAVAAVPEGLPVVLTLTMAVGVTRMAKKRSLIRNLPAVEVLGSSTVICTDKTGTLTKNEMTVKAIWTMDHPYDVTGTGYSDNGDIICTDSAEIKDANDDPILLKTLEVCTLANEASISIKDDTPDFDIFGDPTEVALLILAEKSHLRGEIISSWARQYLFPFDSERKMMSVLVQNKETAENALMIKGATDLLLDLCESKYTHEGIQPMTAEDKERVLTVSNSYSANYAYRILGIAFRHLDQEEATKIILTGFSGEAEKDLTFVGFVAMIDPPRDQSKPSIDKARAAGINVIMITGDHMETAKAIGRSIALCAGMEPISGAQLDEMSDEELEEAVYETEIFARVNPSHKLRIVNALKKQGEVTIMTGDGVNDAPALKRSDIGVAMGISGTDVAKEASDMILTDDNFANIIDAISEGRIIYDNIKRFISYLLSANAGEILTVLLGLVISAIFLERIELAVLAIHLLFINIVTDTFPALALGISAPESNVMRRPPRDPKEPLIGKRMLFKIIFTGILYAGGSMIIFYWTTNWGADLAVLGSETYINSLKRAQTMVFVAIVIFQLFNSISTSLDGSVFSRKIFKNRSLFGAIFLGLALILFAVYVPFMNTFVKTTPLNIEHWGIIFSIVIPIFLAEELRKFIVRKLYPLPDVEEYEASIC
ncbi:MAG: HAD-IC family P-type ATPase [Candidatus Heimdallarchaeota archaeon]|nr:HAD-IC family P-type ATPase [Candidatus Heimdallarchaeota archaeon]